MQIKGSTGSTQRSRAVSMYEIHHIRAAWGPFRRCTIALCQADAGASRRHQVEKLALSTRLTASKVSFFSATQDKIAKRAATGAPSA